MNSPTKRPDSDDRLGWVAYWQSSGQSWRTEPEVGLERQSLLRTCTKRIPDLDRGIFPLASVEPPLTRADIEWLLATHEDGDIVGPVDWSDEAHWQRRGLDVRRANLQALNLSNLPLARLLGGLAGDQWAQASPEARLEAAVQLAGANLQGAHLQFAYLESANLNRAVLRAADLEHAVMREARLEEADLSDARMWLCKVRNAYMVHARLHGTHLEGADMQKVNLEGADLTGAHIRDATLRGAHLVGAVLREANLTGTNLSFADLGHADLTNADLRGATLFRSNLQGAILEGAQLQGGDVRQTMLDDWGT
jgi:uncharacterized protein YjbI with pentapeptide repeats